MLFFTYFTPITYWVLVLMWSFIFLFYIKRIWQKKAHSRLLFTLLIILAIDAFRTLFESAYFGAWYTSLVGFLPKTVHTYLTRPEIVFIPKFINVIAAITVILILLYRWLPQEERETEDLKHLVEKQTRKLSKSNAKLNNEISERKLIEEALRESETRYKGLFYSIRDAILVTDINRNIIDCNHAFIDLFGYQLNEVIGQKTLYVYENEEHYEALGKALTEHYGESPFLKTVNYKKKNGVIFPGETGVFFLKDVKGNVIGFIGLIRDITDRNQAEEELIQSRTQLRILVDTMPDLVWLKDVDGIYLGCNQKFEQFFGAKESNIIGKSDYDFVDKHVADSFRDHDLKVLEFNKPSINEEWLTFSDNGYRGLFETIKTPMCNSSGTLSGVLGVARDITDRKKAEDALIRNEQRYKSAQRMGGVGNWEYDLVTDFFWASHQAKFIFEFDPESDHFTIEEVEKCIPERKRVHQALIDLVERNTPYNLEYEINPASGAQTKTIKSIAELIRDDQNNPIRVVGVIQDITSQKESAKEKLLLEQKLLQSQKMESIGKLAGGIAHDFNNILSSVLGFSEIALDEVEKGSPLEANLMEIYTGGLRAKEIVNQILAFARQSGEEKKPTRVDIVIIEALKLIRPSTPSTIEIRKEIDSSSLVHGNATQIHQIIMNLCTNAAHAMEDNGGIMEVTLKDVNFGERGNIPGGLEKGKYIELAISDTGCGIKPENINSIFDPYFTTKETGKGTGMGLAMILGIVESYGGIILVESTPAIKTIFTIYLPITSELDKEITFETKTLPKGDEHILFVDDEAPIARMASRILESLGYQVTIRTSSIEALELFKAKPDEFQLVITDMTMPHMTGDKFAIELKQIRADIPIILCTGYSNKISAEIAQGIGINAFTYKPFTKADLADSVREVLDKA